MQNISDEKLYNNAGNKDVLSLIDKENGVILDIGCGGGSLAKLLKEKGYIVDGITISETELKAALPFLRNIYLFNLENGLPDEAKKNTYDVIICSHVLEHITYPEKLLKDIYSSLNEGGLLIVALPNIMHYKSRFELLKGNFNYRDMGIWDYTHFRWYTFKSAQSLLESHDFKIVFATVTGKLPFNSFFKKIFPKPIQDKIYRFLILISKGFFGYQLLYKAVKNKI